MKASGFRLLVQVWILVLAIFRPVGVFADGKVFPMTAYAMPEIPDQRALICYADGTETLAIETSFIGQGTNFAWVVPLPAVAKIEQLSTGLFQTLQTIFQPEVVVSVNHYWIALPVAVVAVWLVGIVRRSDFIGFMLVVLVLVLMTLLLPALGTARSRAGQSGFPQAQVLVLKRQTVGLFDTVTIRSTEAQALMRWLNENGFSAPTNMAAVVADYVREGWVFVAIRLNSEAGQKAPQATQATHPLSFTFKTDKPVYPLRLTGIGSTSCQIDLFVFGPGRATVPGFKVKRCEAPDYTPSNTRPRLKSGKLQILNAELRKLVGAAPVATKLSATLDSTRMARDAYVNWVSYRPSGGKLYTRAAALTVSANTSALFLMTSALVWWLLSRFRLRVRLQPEKYGKWLLPGALSVGIIIYSLGLPKADSGSLRMTRSWYGNIRHDLFCLAMAIEDELGNSNLVSRALMPARSLTGAELERLFQAVVRDYQSVWAGYSPRSHPLTNFFTGERIKFEASPGNVILRPAPQADSTLENEMVDETGDRYELVWHDLDGAEAITNLVLSADGLQ